MSDPTFDLQPTLRGDTVLVRPVVEADREDMFFAASDPEIWTQHPSPNRYQRAEFDAFFDGAIAAKSAFSVVDLASNRIIGSTRFWGLDKKLSEIEIGWTFLIRDFWGGRCNREVKNLLLHHAFEYVGTVVFWVGESNLRSRRAVENIGATLRPGVTRRGISGEAPYVVYAITKN